MSLQLMNHTSRQFLNKDLQFAKHDYGRGGVFKINIRLLVQKL